MVRVRVGVFKFYTLQSDRDRDVNTTQMSHVTAANSIAGQKLSVCVYVCVC